MKKWIALMLAMLMICCAAALAETGEAGTKINCLIEDGSYIIQIPVEPGDEGWMADDMSQDDSVVKLHNAEVIDGAFVVRYDPVADGEITVAVRHYDGIACDQAHTWDLRVQDGAVVESFGGSYTASPAPEEQDPYLSGEWLEEETQFTQMTITRAEKGWDVEILSPMTHGAYAFLANVAYDCELDEFVYADGRFYELPITDEESDLPLSEQLADQEPVVSDATGMLHFIDGDPEKLEWYNSQSPDETIVFTR